MASYRRFGWSILLVLVSLAADAVENMDFVRESDALKSGPGPRRIACGDIDQDGRPDLAVCNGKTQGVTLFRNLGSGAFSLWEDIPSEPEPFVVALVDLNGDGWLDMLAACVPVGILDVYINDRTGKFLPRVKYEVDNGCQSFAVVDVNGDRALDVVLGIFSGATIMLGKGDGTFPTKIPQKTEGAIISVAVGDVTGDGIPDMLVDGVRLLAGLGDGRFGKVTDCGVRGSQVALVDLDGNGSLDLVTTGSIPDGSRCLITALNDGKGMFRPVGRQRTGNHMAPITIVDVNGDGRSDVVVSSVHESQVLVYIHRGDGNIDPPLCYPTGKAPNHQIVADLDGDKRLDLATANFFTNDVTILLRRPGPPPEAPNLTVVPFSDRVLRLTWEQTRFIGSLGDQAIWELEISPPPAAEAGSSATTATLLREPRRVVPGKVETLDVPGLVPGAKYAVKARAHDALARPGAWTRPQDVTMPAVDQTPPAAITTLRISSREQAFLVLRWTATGDDGLHGMAAAYDLRMAEKPITEKTFDFATPVTMTAPKASGQEEVLSITKLPAGSERHFAIRVKDEAGNWSPLSKVIGTSTRSTDREPPYQIQDIALIASTPTTATIAWTASGNDGMTGQAAGYVVRYGTSPITSDGTFAAAKAATGVPQAQPPGFREQMTLTGLTTGTRYHVAIRAVDPAGNPSVLSVPFSFTAGQEVSVAVVAPGWPLWYWLVAGLVGLLAAVGLAHWLLRPVDPRRPV